MNFKNKFSGFTLIEVLVVIAIIAILSAVIYSSFDESRKQARDKARTSSLKEMQLALELYKAQYGRYPAGCSAGNFGGPGGAGSTGYSSCTNYVTGHSAGITFVPDFIPSLPNDSRFENDPGKGFYYRTDASGTAYKLIILDSVEAQTVTAGDEFARCPSSCGSSYSTTYGVYSLGAENW